MSRKDSRHTGLVDAVTGRPVLRHPATGVHYVAKGGWPHFWGRVLDAVVVLGVAGVLMTVFSRLVLSYSLGSLSYALASSNGAFFGALLVIWFAVLFGYGMICGAVGGVGDVAVGMRGVRITDGSPAGAWLGGWRAVLWSFFPLYVFLAIATIFSGGGGDDFATKFTAVDLRSGLARGMAPIPDPKVATAAAADAAARTERQNLPNLYGKRTDAGS